MRVGGNTRSTMYSPCTALALAMGMAWTGALMHSSGAGTGVSRAEWANEQGASLGSHPLNVTVGRIWALVRSPCGSQMGKIGAMLAWCRLGVAPPCKDDCKFRCTDMICAV